MPKCRGHFLVGTDTRVTLTAQDEEGNFLNTATVAGTILDEDEEIVLADLVFSHIPDSDGKFTAIVPYSAPFVSGRNYTLHLAINSGGRQMTVKVAREAKHVTA